MATSKFVQFVRNVKEGMPVEPADYIVLPVPPHDLVFTDSIIQGRTVRDIESGDSVEIPTYEFNYITAHAGLPRCVHGMVSSRFCIACNDVVPAKGPAGTAEVKVEPGEPTPDPRESAPACGPTETENIGKMTFGELMDSGDPSKVQQAMDYIQKRVDEGTAPLATLNRASVGPSKKDFWSTYHEHGELKSVTQTYDPKVRIINGKYDFTNTMLKKAHILRLDKPDKLPSKEEIFGWIIESEFCHGWVYAHDEKTMDVVVQAMTSIDKLNRPPYQITIKKPEKIAPGQPVGIVAGNLALYAGWSKAQEIAYWKAGGEIKTDSKQAKDETDDGCMQYEPQYWMKTPRQVVVGREPFHGYKQMVYHNVKIGTAAKHGVPIEGVKIDAEGFVWVKRMPVGAERYNYDSVSIQFQPPKYDFKEALKHAYAEEEVDPCLIFKELQPGTRIIVPEGTVIEIKHPENK